MRQTHAEAPGRGAGGRGIMDVVVGENNMEKNEGLRARIEAEVREDARKLSKE